MKNINHFQIAKVQPLLVSYCLFFCQFQPGVSYKGVAYKKKRVTYLFLILVNKKIFFQEYIEMELKIFFIIFEEFFE